MKPLRTLKNLLRSQRASALPMVGMGLFMMISATGVAIDMGRLQAVQSRMSSALDNAGLAAGAQVNSQDVTTQVNRYFYANFPTGYMGITNVVLTAVPNGTNTIISLTATGTVPMTFMQIFGIATRQVSAASEVTISNKGMELVLVMDNTGSMSQSAGGSTTKIQAAKTAAIDLLTILYGGNETSPNLYVGIVPFSDAVNIGTTGRSAWLDSTYDAGLNWGTKDSWKGCVEARANGSLTPKLDISDDPPSVKPFRQYYAPCNTNSSYSNPWYGTNSSSSGSPSATYNNCTKSGTTQYRTPVYTTSTQLGPNANCPQPVQGMVMEKTTLVNAINSMAAVGNTHIDLGMAWGWRMLSPRWQNLWGGEMTTYQLPLAYNTPLMNKVVVLMTDGDNTLSGSNSAGTATNFPGLYGAYGVPASNALAVTPNECTSGSDCTKGQTEIDSRTAAVCASMKANGVIIYTVALGTSFTTASINLLSGCASNPDFYFQSPTTSELDGIFKQIGDSLANLRISK